MKILYLAKFAPQDEEYCFENKGDEVYYQKYHKPLHDALVKTGNEVISKNDMNFLKNNHNEVDFVFSVYYNMDFKNSDAYISLLCEKYKIPYFGSSPNIRILDNDKVLAKLVAKELGIKTPEFIAVSSIESFPKEINFQPPYFVKPRFGSASRYIDDSCICYDYSSLKKRVKEFLDKRIEVIIEQFVNGIVYNVSAVYNDNLMITNPYTTISNSNKVVTHNEKRLGGVVRDFPNDNIINDKLKKLTSLFFKNIQRCDYARFDYIIENETNEIYFLEVNTTPNLSVTGGFATMLTNEFFGNYEKMIAYFVELGIKRSNEQSKIGLTIE